MMKQCISEVESGTGAEYNRKNTNYRKTMEEGHLDYKIVAEFEIEEDARKYESTLIK
jgi:hypothetical protein